MATRDVGRTRQLLLPAALSITIPGFYLMLDAPVPAYRVAGQVLYGVAALLIALHLSLYSLRQNRPHARHWRQADMLLLVGTVACIWPSAPPWTDVEWLLRLLVCALIFVRLISLAILHAAPRPVLRTCGVALLMLAAAGTGFYWLEPQVHSFGDGLWLAFTTGATVGYGDLVPSTPASRVFAVFIVLLGYALLSLVTASIAALLVGEDEKLIRRELHADMRLLQHEIALLREDIAAEQRRAAKERGG